MQDYPPNGDLEKVHRKLYDTFIGCIPRTLAPHVAPRGPLNLFSYFPQGSVMPDLGMYGFIILSPIVIVIEQLFLPCLGPKLYVSEVRYTLI